MDCVYGGQCIDPGSPSDCKVNGGCICFSSVQEKTDFDSLPKSYKVKSKTGEIFSFATQTQVDFYIIDFGGKQL